MQSMHEYLTVSTLPIHRQPLDQVQHQQLYVSGPLVVPTLERGYEPYLYKTFFHVPDHSESIYISSSYIVFNMGLAHHLDRRIAPHSANYYEIAASMLSIDATLTPDTLLLRMALLNNLGVWCYENGEGDSMRTYMEELSLILTNENVEGNTVVTSQSGSEAFFVGIRSNIQWLLTPLNGGSPAA